MSPHTHIKKVYMEQSDIILSTLQLPGIRNKFAGSECCLWKFGPVDEEVVRVVTL